MPKPAERPHTGRRRNEAAREAILDAALRVLHAEGQAGFKIETVAREAGVGKQTIYRWWPSRSAIVVEAALTRARRDIPPPDTGSLAGDLEAFLGATYATAAQPDVAAGLRFLMAEAQSGGEPAATLRAFVEARRAVLRSLFERGIERGDLPAGTDVDLRLDVAFGLLWYRVLVGHAPLGRELATDVARLLA